MQANLSNHFSPLRSFVSRRLAALPFLSAIASFFLAGSALAVTPNFVQGNSAVPQTAQSKVTVPFTAAQKLGDLNVVVVGWGDATHQISSVTDSKGNLYLLASGPTVLTGSAALTQSVYYAKNIGAALAGANVVTLSFNAAVASPDIRILEYSGIDPVNALDVSAAATGNSSTSTSGAVLTTNPMDLLVGANVVWTSTTAPGSGFTQRMITSPDGDIAMDRVVTATGSYSASASLGSAGPWIMDLVAFRAAGTAAPTPTPTPVPTPTPAPSPVALAYVQGNFSTPQSPLTLVTSALFAPLKKPVTLMWSSSAGMMPPPWSLPSPTPKATFINWPPALQCSPVRLPCPRPFTTPRTLPQPLPAPTLSRSNLTPQPSRSTCASWNTAALTRSTPWMSAPPPPAHSASSSSGTVLTKNAKDLLIGANMVRHRLHRPRQRFDPAPADRLTATSPKTARDRRRFL